MEPSTYGIRPHLPVPTDPFDPEANSFDLVEYIRVRAIAAGMTPEQVAAEVAWAVQYISETDEERAARIKAEAMRDHPFVGDGAGGPYCQDMGREMTMGSREFGQVTMRVQCGYPADLHPDS
jgi:hypothetical protein